MKKLLIFIMTVFVGVGAVGFISQVVKNEKDNEAEKDTLDRIVELTNENGTLNEKQVNLLSSGADITYDSDVYRLSKVGDEKIYEHTDGENIFLTKYIGVDTEKRTFRTWEKLNNDVVTKALMNSALTEKDSALKETLKEYVTDDQMTKILADYEKGADLTETLKKYVTEEKVNAILSGYYTKKETQNFINQALLSYVKKSDGKDVVVKKALNPGEQLIFEAHSMYVVQCYDSSTNLADFTILGGGKNGDKGRLAMVFIGDKINNTTLQSLMIYQTGSINISNLAGTSGASYGIKPSNNSCCLSYYKIGGQVL